MGGSEAGGKGSQRALFLKVNGTRIGVSRGGIEIVGARQMIGDTTSGGEGDKEGTT